MIRLLVEVEGQTEEEFVYNVLAPYLYEIGYDKVSASLMGNARLRRHRGGVRSWSSVKLDFIRHLKSDPSIMLSTMVDFYGMPKTGDSEWPGRLEADSLPFAQKASRVEEAMLDDISAELPECRTRLIPFVVMHEFEALLFSNCNRFAEAIALPEKESELQRVRDLFSTPEMINDSPFTAPSKRISDIIPGYQKPLYGTLAALEIGIGEIRNECPHFNTWLTRLEQLIVYNPAD